MRDLDGLASTGAVQREGDKKGSRYILPNGGYVADIWRIAFAQDATGYARAGTTGKKPLLLGSVMHIVRSGTELHYI